MTYCSKCGHKIEIEAAYCPKCGNVLEKETVKKDLSEPAKKIDRLRTQKPTEEKKEPVRASEQDPQQTSDSNEVLAIKFDMKHARRDEMAWSIVSVLFIIGGILPFLFTGIWSSEFWLGVALMIIGVLLAVAATIYNSKVRNCKKELIRLGAYPNPDQRVKQQSKPTIRPEKNTRTGRL